MKMTVDFYVGVLGMRLVHAMTVPPGVGTGPGNRGNPPFEEIRHYFFDMGGRAVAFFEIPRHKSRATATRSARCSMSRSRSPRYSGTAARAPR
jgi:catechol 2,3-dioxygenase-like lactoylglutathione lyase family enzyme